MSGLAILVAGWALAQTGDALAEQTTLGASFVGVALVAARLFFLADVVYREGPILAATDRSAFFAATIGMAVTCTYLLALVERRDRTILGMGIGSFAVLLMYFTGLVGLYSLR